VTTSALILCDGVGARALNGFEETVLLSRQPPNPTLSASIDEFSHALFQNLDDDLADLVRIAAFVYGADGSVSRGTVKDVYATKWCRKFHFCIPVIHPDLWNRRIVKQSLSDCLSFLSEDQFEFEFIQGKPDVAQLQFEFGGTHALPNPGVDCVLLLSGGLDSLAAAIEAVRGDGLHPVLVSQWSSTRVKSRQRAVIEGLREKITEWAFPWIGMWIHAVGKQPVDRTQRCRSFLFLSLAYACASQMKIPIIRICDNGLTSANIPHTNATWGTFLTRSTHPKYLDLFSKYVTSLGGMKAQVENTLLLCTKADIIKKVVTNGCSELIQETSSCAQTNGMTKAQPHCGVCYQCVDRRFASEITGSQSYDLPQMYEIDIFEQSIKEGIARTHVENYVRFAQDVQSMSEDDFIEKYSELWECVLHLASQFTENQLRELARLHIRHAKDVWKYVEKMCEKLAGKRARGELPDDCLISMVLSGELKKRLDEKSVRGLGELFKRGLPISFQHESPKSETQVQDAGAALLASQSTSLDREVPLLPFAGISTKPDFSMSLPRGWLFIEFKYPKERSRLNSIITEMTSRVNIYHDQDAFILFVVYDPERTIVNDDKFTADFEKHEGVWVAIVR